MVFDMCVRVRGGLDWNPCLLRACLMRVKDLVRAQDVFRAILYADMDFDRGPWPDISADGKALVQALLCRDPACRPTAAEALAHPWFNQLDTEPMQNGGGRGRGPLLDTVVQRLQRFGTYGRLKQAALVEIAAASLPIAGDTDMVREIKETFAELDADGDGRVPYAAMVDLLKRGDFDLSETEIEVLVSQMDSTEQGYVRCAAAVHIVSPLV
jgi:calcium-dependent protein kinase